jgi:pyruvate ferredoxin oxidoreductase gamma subunit
MISVKLVGRGGQGIKSSARIVGTAAFLGGFNVQDQPIYGAERRGAPVLAFIRISSRQILERGPIGAPSLLVIADDSLMDDPSLKIFETLPDESHIFVNTPRTANSIAAEYHLANKISVADLDEMAERCLDKPIVSAALAGAISRLLGQNYADLRQAMTLELSHIGIGGQGLAGNFMAAREAYDSLSPMTGIEVKTRGENPAFAEVPYHPPKISTSTILSPGNTGQRRVGMWARYKPKIDNEICTKCRICFVYCPDSAIHIGKDDFPFVDYDACKGCDICFTECPVKAIMLVKRKGT